MAKKFIITQNNAGGFYLAGMPKKGIIAAKTIEQAIAVAEVYGIDFTADGCEGCCGDRWYLAEYDPEWHGANVPDFINELLAPIG